MTTASSSARIGPRMIKTTQRHCKGCGWHPNGGPTGTCWVCKPELALDEWPRKNELLKNKEPASTIGPLYQQAGLLDPSTTTKKMLHPLNAGLTRLYMKNVTTSAQHLLSMALRGPTLPSGGHGTSPLMELGLAMVRLDNINHEGRVSGNYTLSPVPTSPHITNRATPK